MSSLDKSDASDGFVVQRQAMVRTVQRQGVTDSRVCSAMLKVPREMFVAEEIQEHAYDDAALPIGLEQTISQPYIVALMAAVLELSETDRVLEVGAGSGYAAAILSHLAAEVYALERLPELALTSQERLRKLGIANAQVAAGDGTLGWPDHAPYNKISVAAGAAAIPPPLLKQLAAGGRLVMPLGNQRNQKLVLVTRDEHGQLQQNELCNVRFVPLIGNTE